MHKSVLTLSLAALLAFVPLPGGAQQPDTAALLASEVEAMRAFAMLDGVWRGPAMTLLPDGRWRTIVQTERIGPFLGGSIRVIEGNGGSSQEAKALHPNRPLKRYYWISL